MNNQYPKPEITNISDKRLAGKKIITSLTNNKTGELWKSFMPLRHQLKGVIGTERYSLQIYPYTYFDHFNPITTFEKWAAVEISAKYEEHPEMETITLPAGLYAIFHYKGSSTDTSIFQYIFTQWLPASGYELDDRPHFEILGDKYKNADPDSEEDIYIPVKPRTN